MKYRNLNMGCGELSQPDCLNADIRKTSIVETIVDFDRFPYPFKDGSFDNVYAVDIIEHLDDVIKVMEEIHRILKSNGKVFIRTTYWKMEQSFRDPTHRHFFTLESFDYFDPSTSTGQKYNFYSDRKFKILNKYIDGQETMFELIKVQ